MKLEILKNKKVLVLGLGREGESSFRFLRKNFPQKIIALADQLTPNKLPATARGLIKRDKKINPVRSKTPKASAASLMRTSNGVKLHLGKNYLRAIKDYDVIIKTPGISIKTIAPFISKNQIIISQTEIFLEKYRNQTIGITGTKGKGTTAGLIYKTLKDAGFNAKLIGNMGKPALDYFGNGKYKGWFVAEISSHQLENLKISPHIAVFVNIYPDHLDYFKNFQEYFGAKANITKWQKANDYFIFNNDFPELKKLAKMSKAKTIGFSKKTKAKKGNKFFLSNTLAASTVAWLFKIPFSKVQKSIKGFKNIEHRLEFVGKIKGIEFYNDSASTIPEATLAALSFLNNVYTLILGGSEKGSDFKTLAKAVIEKKIKKVILFPVEGKRIWREICRRAKWAKKKLPRHFFANNMKEAVRHCFAKTPKGKICLLSPGCASFTTFKNYEDRGKQFKKYIKELSLSRRRTPPRST